MVRFSLMMVKVRHMKVSLQSLSLLICFLFKGDDMIDISLKEDDKDAMTFKHTLRMVMGSKYCRRMA